MKDECPYCGELTNEAYEMSDGEYVCGNCYQDGIARAESMYDALREEGKI